MTTHSDATPEAGSPARGTSPRSSHPRIPHQRSGPAPGAAGSPDWQRRFARTVATVDVLVVLLTVSAGVVGISAAYPDAGHAPLVCGVLTGVLLVVTLPMCRAWEGRVLGQGIPELTRLGRAVALADVALALGALALLVGHARIWVFGVMPVVGTALLVARWVLRKWLHQQRAAGRFVLPVLAVGSERAVADLVRRTRRDVYYGWQVTGACTPTGTGTGGVHDIDGAPVLGDLDAVSAVAHGGQHRIVAVCQAPGWGPHRLHRLAWALEDTSTELAVDPGLMEIAGPRMHIAPVDGMPLLRLSHPRFTGTSRMLKTAFDRGVAALLLLLSTPVLVAIAVAVRCGDRGPVFFTQVRVGANGRTFRMIKFRSMCRDAESRRAALGGNDGAGPLFKLQSDPRVTRVGRVLRKYSLDELPQLVNVLNGTMSLVGPRPPLPSEVAGYADDARRRLLVRPGMTGLWQVSGRSSLSWEESVRLDLRYVENWSPAMDLVILWKTIGAVLHGRGAY